MKLIRLITAIVAFALAFAPKPTPYSGVVASGESAYESRADLLGATLFVFSESGITVQNGKYSGYSIAGNELKLEESGTYVLRGSTSNASVKIRKGITDVVLVLGGVVLKSETTAPIVCAKGSEALIIAASGTVNTLEDNELNNDKTHTDNTDAENAVIKCKDGSNVVIAGGGTLNIVANGNNGIKGGASTEYDGDSSLTIAELTLNITAPVGDALKSDAELNIVSGTVNVDAYDDGIKSELVLNIGKQGTEGPSINVINSTEGIEGAMINIYSGDITVNAYEDGVNAANGDLVNYSFAMNVYGGRLYINSQTGDGIDSNGVINIEGGEVAVHSSSRSDNSPFDSDDGFTLKGGTVFGIGMPGMGALPNTVEQTYIVFGANSGFVGGFGGGFPGGDPPAMPGGDPPTMPGGDPPAMPGGFGGNTNSGISLKEGDEIVITDSNGNTVCTTTAKRTSTFVFFSSADLKTGDTYKLIVNGTEAASTQATTEAGANMFPGGKGGWGKGGRGSTDNGISDSKHNTGDTHEKPDIDAPNEGKPTRVPIIVCAAMALVTLASVIALVAVAAKNRKLKNSNRFVE